MPLLWHRPSEPWPSGVRRPSGLPLPWGLPWRPRRSRSSQSRSSSESRLKRFAEQMRETRPTAVNLFWAVDRMKKILDQVQSDGVEETRKRLEEEALQIYEEDMDVNRKIGRHGKESDPGGRRGAHPLQCRGPGHGRIRDGPGSDLCGVGRREEVSRSLWMRQGPCSRGQADGLGTGSGEDSGHAHHRQHGRG